MNPLFFLSFLGSLMALGGLGSSDSGGPSSSAGGQVPGPTPVPDGPPKDEPQEPPTGADPIPAPEPAPPVIEDPEPEPQPEPEPPVAEEPEPEPQPEPEPPVAEEPEPEPQPEPEPPVAEEPEPEPQPEPEPPVGEAPGVADPAPTAPDQTGGSGEDGGETATQLAEGTVSVFGGRVATLEPVGDNVVGVEILSDVAHGSLTVNPDNTMALVMTRSDFVGTQSFEYQTTYADGSTSTHSVNLNVEQGLQDFGWGTSEMQYMLATDENDLIIPEHGDVHTKVFISGSSSALTRADIAAMEGISEGQVTGAWLAANTTYGQSEETALADDIGMELWHTVTPARTETSNWLMFERGYDYDTGQILLRGAHGESELHPVYVGAYGEGDRPILNDEFRVGAESANNAVIQNVHITGGAQLLDANNMIFDNVAFSETESVVINSDGITFRNSDFIDVVREESANGGDWETHSDRYQGLFVQFTEGLLLDGLFLDHSAWADDYDPNGAASGGQPPSMFSHNLYLADTIEDLTLRDTVSMRAAGTAAQVRSGGFIEDNIFLDSPTGVNFFGGGGEYHASYTLFADNVITSAGYREAFQSGALGWGADSQGQLSTMVDNIITHAADPNNPAEQAFKEFIFWSYNATAPHYYDDTIVYNWEGSGMQWDNLPESNIGDLDTSVLDQTTIQLFTAQLLGQPTATIDDLAEFLRDQAADGMANDVIDADTIVNYFQTGFGLDPGERAEATTLRFVPDDLGDGVRWDNRLNWDTDDLPGTVAGDSVDLGGNEVVYNANATIDTLDLSGGMLDAYGGRLTVTGGIEGDDGTLEIQEAGQIWADGSDGSDFDIDLMGGRFVNTGQMSGGDLSATGGEAILASDDAEFDVVTGDTLSVSSTAEVGFDGENGGQAILDLHDDAMVAFMGGGDGGLGEIAEFRSGAFGDAPNVQSGIDLGGSDVTIDLAGVSGSSFTLMSADEIVGLIDDATVTGLGGRDATITVDYTTDTVSLSLTSGSGNVSVQTVGDQGDVSGGYEALWNDLTSGQGVVSDSAPSALDDEIDDIAA